MRHLHAIAAYLAVLTGISLAAAIVQGFTLLRLADCAFLVGLVSLILSGIYYLKRQGAYAGLGNVSKSFSTPYQSSSAARTTPSSAGPWGSKTGAGGISPWAVSPLWLLLYYSLWIIF